VISIASCATTILRSHQGYQKKGRTPALALKDALGNDNIPTLLLPEEVPERFQQPLD
jgi:hypothetical protein